MQAHKNRQKCDIFFVTDITNRMWGNKAQTTALTATVCKDIRTIME